MPETGADSSLEKSMGNNLIEVDEENFVDPELALQQTLDDPNLAQHVTRTRHDNRDTIIGYFRINFEPRQTRQVLHVPITPPLRNVPKVEAHATSHDGVRVRVTDCQKFGIRAEVILSHSIESSQRIMVEMIATET